MSAESVHYPRPVLVPAPVAADTAANHEAQFRLALGFTEFNHSLSIGSDSVKAIEAILSRCAEAVPGAQYAALTLRSAARKPPKTLASTHPVAAALEKVQLDVGQGPSLTALEATGLIQVPDLLTDGRWRLLQSRLGRMPLRSVLSVPITAPDEVARCLTFYAEGPNAFGDEHHPIAYLAAAAMGLALISMTEHERAEHLSVALESNRLIGTAMGILMAEHHCSYEDAFAALRVTSQHAHRKLRDVADEVIFTGALPSGFATLGS
jgi:hypothetical protein